jgi:asparagine synthase (glutamine-hydrolysing)
MAETVPAAKIRTFAIGFKEKKYDESGYAREVARHFGTSHEEEILDPGRMLEILPSIIRQLDEPFADPSIVPTYLLCQKTRRHVTVALGGDGGDELFAGYGFFGWHRWANRLGRITPAGMQQRMANWSRQQPRWLAGTKAGYKLGRFLYPLPRSPEVRQIFWMGAVYPLMHRDLWLESRDREVDGVYDALGRHAAECPSADPLQRSLHVYYQTYLQEDILAKVDRASMMHSLEVRAPFLDYRLVEYVSKLPFSYKLRDKTTKYILKKALAGRIPHNILHRRKKGFAVPLGKWFRDELSGELRETLSAKRIRAAGLFNPACITRMVEEHISGRRDWRKPLWTLYVFEKWRENWAIG